jgi:hypothetical protein
MSVNLRHYKSWLYGVFCLALSLSLSAPAQTPSSASPLQVMVEDPLLNPPFTTCPETYWYSFLNDRAHPAYLTLNVNDPLHSSNYAEWHPLIPQAGYYQVEAYIPNHDPIIWCTGTGRSIEHDTADAHYYIHYASGVAARELSQYPLSNTWLNLGEYYFNVGNSGYVALTDLNHEKEYSNTISFSAMRFTYTRSARPATYLPLVSLAYTPANPLPDVGVVQAQGFDSCSLPSISQMQTWWNSSPYSFYGLYLGGAHLPSMCTTATSSWVSAVHQQGWSFIPTWVGLQAPCTKYAYKMSSDPAIAYQQGQQEALAASYAAASKGLTNNGVGGTIIYYDLEPFGDSRPECRLPVQALMNGWVEKLHELGNRAGGYGSRNSYVSDWATIAHVPNDVWAASWYAETYDPYATVLGISWLEGLWTGHQRIRQYAGDVSNQWGGVKLSIDIDVADGEVAMPPNHTLAPPLLISDPPVEDTGWLTADGGWLVSEGHLYWTHDQGRTWRDISPAPIQLAYFLPSGAAWAVSAAYDDSLVLYASANGGTSWEKYQLAVLAGEWEPIQMQFTSSTNGWIVLQKVASQAFDEAVWLKTGDGGLSWQTFELPMAGTVSLGTSADGWLVSRNQERVFHTQDNGLSWQPSELAENPQASANLPDGTTISGWQAGGLGWAVTSSGSCQGDKGTNGFSCQVRTGLWLSTDHGKSWEPINPPAVTHSKQ